MRRALPIIASGLLVLGFASLVLFASEATKPSLAKALIVIGLSTSFLGLLVFGSSQGRGVGQKAAILQLVVWLLLITG